MQDYGNSPHIDPRATFSRSDTTSSGDWNASTNAPGLADGSGTANQYYRVSVAGTQDLGSGSITYAVGDYVKFSGSVWYKTTQPIGVTYWSNEKHLSSENLLLQSSNFTASWSTSNIAVSSTASAAPDSSSSAYLVYPNVNSSAARVYQTVQPSAGRVVISAYAKPAGKTSFGIIEKLLDGSTNYSWFDLSGSGSVGTSDGGHTAAISQSGNGYYRCSIALTASGSANSVMFYVSDATGSTTATASGTDGVYIYGTQVENLSSGGPTALNATTTQIHREYAPSLKYVTPATGGMARFEYDPASDGQSIAKGILIEGQSTNLQRYGSSVSNWSDSSTVAVTSDAGVSPSGTLTADLLVSPASAGAHYVLDASIAFAASTTYTASIYVKSAGHQYIQLCGNSNAFGSGKFANFDLVNGTTSATNATSTIDAVGNGWYRVSLTAEATTAVTSSVIVMFADSLSDGFFPTTTGDAYSGFLVWGYQIETGSFASSLTDTGTSSSTATRALESLSVATADIPGFSEGVGTVVYETGGVASATETNQLGFGLRADNANFFAAGVNNGGVTDASVRVYSKTSGGDQAFLNPGTATVGTGYKLACRFELDNIAASMNGGTVVSDTSGQVPVGVDTLWVGQLAGNYYLNSNIKRIALYNEALSDTNLQALTS